MKIISCNVNGIRASHKRGLLDWIEKSNANIICLQETKALKEEFPKEITDDENQNLFTSNQKPTPKKYHLFINPAEKKGYSGVAILTKGKPKRINYDLGLKRFDQEGRFIELEYRNFILINIYIPHGNRDKRNINYKLEVYKKFIEHLKKIKGKEIILVGDFNVAHKEKDLKNYKQNHDNIMFTLKEREQIDKIIDLGFIDSFRRFNQEEGNYTWWLYAFNSKERNVGWRIDYIFTSPKITSKLKNTFISKEIEISDHCPTGIELK